VINRRQILSTLGGAIIAQDIIAGGYKKTECNQNRSKGENSTDDPRREQLYSLLGDVPPGNQALSARVRSEEEYDGYILQTLELDLNGIESVPAYFVKPLSQTDEKLPVVLYNHSHGGGHKVGKTEFIKGRSYLYRTPYAKDITAQGWAGLCIDHWVFGERSHTSEADMFKAMLWQGQVLWGMMVYDSIRAVEYLTMRSDVDSTRIGTLGMSMGSTMGWWLAALDTRIKVTVDICCLTDFHTLLKKDNLRRHGIYYYVPRLLKYFTTAQINSLIAPRAHLAIAGIRDPLTPVEGLDIIQEELDRTYQQFGAADKWRLLRLDTGHRETREGRQAALSFLKLYL